MTTSDWKPEASIAEIRRLASAGMLGFYSRVETTELIAFSPNTRQPINLLTLLVAEEHPTGQAIEPHFLNQSRIRIPSLRDWSFGVYRYSIPLDQLVPAFERLANSRTWDASGTELHQSICATRPPQFVPPNSVEEIPWNCVLRNNFWNGSYIIEWADTKKAELDLFFAVPHRLQDLSEKIQLYLPIRLASLSDRLGNIILQLPVTLLMAQFNSRHDGSMLVETGWHPHAHPRPLRASVELEFDKSITGYITCPVTNERTLLSLPFVPGSHRVILFDEENSLLLAATGPMPLTQTIILNTRVIDPEPRVFGFPDSSGVLQSHRVQIIGDFNAKSRVGPSENDGNGGWTRRRKYRDETSRLVRERHFVQYRPRPGQQAVEHEKALRDIRHLITRYGEEGTWLWDPYLSALDILKTLFFSPYSMADMRGLTAQREATDQISQTCTGNFIQRQKNTLANAQSNFHEMRLEYRAKTGQYGWDFHDRFLIFPRKERGALAWSLGTSINSVGKAHHILQRVDDGQQVMDAFAELWDQLDRPEHLILKVPTR